MRTMSKFGLAGVRIGYMMGGAYGFGHGANLSMAAIGRMQGVNVMIKNASSPCRCCVISY